MHGRKKSCKGALLVPVSRINHIYSHMHVNKTLVGKVQFRCIHGRRGNSLLRNSAETSDAIAQRHRHQAHGTCLCVSSQLAVHA